MGMLSRSKANLLGGLGTSLQKSAAGRLMPRVPGLEKPCFTSQVGLEIWEGEGCTVEENRLLQIQVG